MARDRFGVKPLYFHESPERLVFASEIRAVLNGSRITQQVNEGLLYDFLLNGRLDHTEETFFEGVRRLPAGSCMVVNATERHLDSYWKLSLQPNEDPFKTNVERFRELFFDAVRLQMRSDVPVGACLSGGLDSSSVVAVASRQSPQPMHVFTARYRHPKMDEWRWASAVHEECPVEPVAVFAEPDEFWRALDVVLVAQEEPFAGPGVFAQWRLMKAIHDAGIKVVLDGQGGDELLCGYAKCFYFHLRDLLSEREWLKAVSTWLQAVVNGGPQLLNLSGARRYFPGTWWAQRMKCELLQPDFAERHRCRVVEHPGGSVAQQQIMDIERFSFPVLLRYEDKNSMWHSVESRVPFLDHRLVEFAVNLPTDHKIQGGMAKRILREALKGILPERIRQRRSKLGFGGHWHLWVCDLRPQLAEWVNRPRLAIDPYVRRAALRRWVATGNAEVFRFLAADRWLASMPVQGSN